MSQGLCPGISALSSKSSNPFVKFVPQSHRLPRIRRSLVVESYAHGLNISSPSSEEPRRDLRAFAGRSKARGPMHIKGLDELRREVKQSVRKKAQRYRDSFFFRLKNPHKNFPDNFTEDELQMIGLGYDRFVRFMDKDDPNLKHPHDWYKYGEFGPYSWRGVVLGDPVRGDFSDERVTLMGTVRDQEEWEKIEQHDMAIDYQEKLNVMDGDKRRRYFWVFVRHPKWRIADLPWQQWTLVCEVALEAGDQRLDKWTLMGRLGAKTRSLITQCAAWMRPDIIYVKRPVFQCRFEPQEEFFAALAPMLDPETEDDYPCELVNDDGTTELCTYFGGLCRIVKANPKSFVDDVVKAFEKLSDEKKSKCLEFLLTNHPVMLLHPYTNEWKTRMDEMELGCDAPDEDDNNAHDDNEGESEILDWIEEEEEEEIEEKEEEEGLGMEEESDGDPEEDPSYWDEEFKKAMRSVEGMEKLLERSADAADEFNEKVRKSMREEQERMAREKTARGYEGELEMRGKRAKVSREEWESQGYVGTFRRKVRRSRIPPALFLRAAVRPFTYRRLVKEIVLTRHAIVEGDLRPR